MCDLQRCHRPSIHGSRSDIVRCGNAKAEHVHQCHPLPRILQEPLQSVSPNHVHLPLLYFSLARRLFPEGGPGSSLAAWGTGAKQETTPNMPLLRTRLWTGNFGDDEGKSDGSSNAPWSLRHSLVVGIRSTPHYQSSIPLLRSCHRHRSLLQALSIPLPIL